jgi:hypothetical protein
MENAMTEIGKQQQLLDTLSLLAERICSCPECADTGVRLLELASELNACLMDRAAVRDAIEAQTIEDLSETKVEIATDAVMASMRRAG